LIGNALSSDFPCVLFKFLSKIRELQDS